MNEFERFPILTDFEQRRKHPDWPMSIPFRLIAPHKAQAMANHGGQTLARLAERGGLSPLEMLAVLTDQPFERVRAIQPDDAITQIMKLGGIRRAPANEPQAAAEGFAGRPAEFGDRSPCKHERLTEEGYCRKCGEDCRGSVPYGERR